MALTGCESGFQRIDSQVQKLLIETSDRLGPDALPPDDHSPEKHLSPQITTDPTARTPPTNNPSAAQLQVKVMGEAEDVLARLRAYNQVEGQARELDLDATLEYASSHSREYRFAEEEYVLAALRMLVEEHRWGPQFFDDVLATASANGDDGLFDSSLNLVNDFHVTQRLPYGGEVSARALARATEDLHQRVAGENVQDASIILSADIPLLRGAGLVAQEDRIQAERNLVYAARDFEQFRRDFLFDIAQDFLDLVLSQNNVANAERQVARLQLVEQRQRRLYEAGRTTRFEAALAEQSTVSGLDTLNSRRESFRLAVDRFKVRLGIPLEESVTIAPSSLELPIPDADIEQAVRLSALYRLDVQTQRDRVDDAIRGVANARNQLLPDLNLVGAAVMNTDPERTRAGVTFTPDDNRYSGGLSLSLPLDREIERLNVRQAQIQLERTRRGYDSLRDEVAVNVRAAVRDIDRARYTLQIQEKSVAIGEQRKASIEAAPDRATARDQNDAANELLRAQDRRDSARRDLQVAILRYLRETGQLRVSREGRVLPLSGMQVRP